MFFWQAKKISCSISIPSGTCVHIVISKTFCESCENERNCLIQNRQCSILLETAFRIDFQFADMMKMMTLIAKTNPVFRAVRTAFTYWNDVVIVINRFSAARALPVLTGNYILIDRTVAFHSSVLEVNASYGSVFHCHESKLIDLKAPAGDWKNPADLINMIQRSSYQMADRRSNPFRTRDIHVSMAFPVIEPGLCILNVLHRHRFLASRNMLSFCRKRCALCSVFLCEALAGKSFSSSG